MNRLVARWIDKLSYAAWRRLVAHPAYSRMIVTQGTLASLRIRQMDRIGSLADVEFRVFSQFGEDGILEWLIHKNGEMPESFIEFGASNYVEANTRFLLTARNWRGLIFDGDPHSIDVVRSDMIYSQHDLAARHAFITRENVNQLFRSEGFCGEVGLLSIDIDGNDYWVWDAIDSVSPHIVVVEYNAVLGDQFELTIPYQPNFARTQAHWSNLYYGASITALMRLAREKGYTLLGTNRAGNNAFFVRDDRLERFDDRIATRAPRPSRFREARDTSDHLIFTGGLDRARLIADCLVVDVASGRTASIESFGQLYSQPWLDMIRGQSLPGAERDTRTV